MTSYTVNILGRAGGDAEIRSTTSGAPMASVSLAVDMINGENKTTMWERAVAFGPTAELLRRVQKGDMVGVAGRINQRKWIDADKNERTSREVVAYQVTLLPNGSRPTTTQETTETGTTGTSITPPVPEDMP